MSAEEVDLREIVRPCEQEMDLLWKSPILVIDRLIGLRLTRRSEGGPHSSTIAIFAPVIMPITFDMEDNNPVFHQNSRGEIENPHRLSVKHVSFGPRVGKRRFLWEMIMLLHI